MTEDAEGREDALKRLARMGQQFIGAIPHNRALNMEILGLMAGEATMRVPWDARFVGDPAKSGEKILEAIQMAWLEEYRDAQEA